jgi:hypothetical protein
MNIMRRFFSVICFISICGFVFSAEPPRKRQRTGEVGVTDSDPFPFLMLPRELAFEVAGCLSAKALTNLRATCRGLYEGFVGEGVPRNLRMRAILAPLSMQEKQEALVGAAITGDAELVRSLLLEGADPFVPEVVSFYCGLFRQGRANRLRAIEWAAIYGNVKVVEAIVNYEMRDIERLCAQNERGELNESNREEISLVFEKARTFNSMPTGRFFITLIGIVGRLARSEQEGQTQDAISNVIDVALLRSYDIRRDFERRRLLCPPPPIPLQRQNAMIEPPAVFLYPGAILPMVRIGSELSPIRSLEELLGSPSSRERTDCEDGASAAAAAVGSEDV